MGNKEASNIELIKVDSKNKFRSILLSNNGDVNGVARPEAIVLDPAEGKMYWIDEGGAGVPAKLAKANMDGTQSKILTRDIEKPTGLTIDYDKNVLYYSYGSKA